MHNPLKILHKYQIITSILQTGGSKNEKQAHGRNFYKEKEV